MNTDERLKEISATLVSLMVFIMAGLLLWLSIGVKNWFVHNNAVGKMFEDASGTRTNGQLASAEEWNIYENKEFGFVLNYPSSWIVEEGGFVDESDSENEKSYRLFFSLNSEEKTMSFDISASSDKYIGLTIYPSHVSLQDFLCSSQEEKKTCFSRKVFVSGVSMIVKTLEQSGGLGKKREIFFMKDGNIFHLFTLPYRIPQNDSLSLLNEKIFIIDQIATSIRFVK